MTQPKPKTWKDVEVAFKSKFIRDDGLMSKYYYGENEEEVTTDEAIISFLRTAIQQAFEAVMPKEITAKSLKKIRDFGIEGTNSYNTALSDLQENVKKFFGDE